MFSAGGGDAPGETDVPSVAVLPFVDMRPGGDQAYFGDGVAEEILNALNNLQNLRVASRTSTFRMRDAELSDIGEQLDVAHVLEGSVRQQGDAVRVTARLTAVEDGTNLWSQTFDGPVDDVFGIQEEISQAVVSELRVRLLGDEGDALTARGTENVAAYNRYLQGRFQWNQRTAVSLQAAIESFQEAALLDPDYAMAFVGLGDTYSVLGGQGLERPIDVFPPAKEAVNRALELDPGLAEAHRGLALIRYMYDYDWVGSEEAFQRALELSPNDGFARYWYSLLLDTQGRYDEAEAQVLRARQLDPVAMQIAVGAAQHFQSAGDFGRSIDEFRRATETDPTYPVAWLRGAEVLLNIGQPSTALEWLEESERLGRSAPPLRARILRALGREAEAGALMRATEASRGSAWVSLANVVMYYAEAGDIDSAVRWMETAIAERSILLTQVTRANTSVALWSDPRFVRLLQQVGLEAVPER
jgi:serine/threonine-protein kinase